MGQIKAPKTGPTRLESLLDFACGSGSLLLNVRGRNQLTQEHIAKIVSTYQYRKEEPRYSRRVQMDEIAKNDFNLNISRYISTAVGADAINLLETNAELMRIEDAINAATRKHNAFLQELNLPLLPI